MAETKRLTVGGIVVEVTEVEIAKRRKEDINEYELEDGAIIRVVNPAVVVYRVENARDPEGQPGYLVKLGTSVTTVRGPRTEKKEGE